MCGVVGALHHRVNKLETKEEFEKELERQHTELKPPAGE